MLRRLARSLLLLVSMLGLMPGMNEAAEQIAELIEHGHPAHSVPGEHGPIADEHGCTPVQHRCPCHQGQGFDLHEIGSAGAGAAVWMTWMIDEPSVRHPRSSDRRPVAGDRLALSRANAPPTPPPNA